MRTYFTAARRRRRAAAYDRNGRWFVGRSGGLGAVPVLRRGGPPVEDRPSGLHGDQSIKCRPLGVMVSRRTMRRDDYAASPAHFMRTEQLRPISPLLEAKIGRPARDLAPRPSASCHGGPALVFIVATICYIVDTLRSWLTRETPPAGRQGSPRSANTGRPELIQLSVPRRSRVHAGYLPATQYFWLTDWHDRPRRARRAAARRTTRLYVAVHSERRRIGPVIRTLRRRH